MLIVGCAGIGGVAMVQQPVTEVVADTTCGSLLRELQVCLSFLSLNHVANVS